MARIADLLPALRKRASFFVRTFPARAGQLAADRSVFRTLPSFLIARNA